jgi:hypothetical protein
MTDKRLSLETLENKSYGDSSTAPTALVKRCIELSKKPIGEFTVSDLRVMIGQQFGLPYLFPIALEKLQDNLFIETDYYEGDLLAAVLNVDAYFWKENNHYWIQLYNMIKSKKKKLGDLKIETTKFDNAKSYMDF